MRELTRWQIIQACGLGSGIDTVIVDNDGVNAIWQYGPITELEEAAREEKTKKVEAYLKREKEKLPQETQQHLNHMTCHQELMVEIVFKENIHAEAD